jgi:hypothetical protein
MEDKKFMLEISENKYVVYQAEKREVPFSVRQDAKRKPTRPGVPSRWQKNAERGDQSMLPVERNTLSSNMPNPTPP